MGGNNHVNVASWKITSPFEVYHSASMRDIIDLNDLSASLMINTTGQSGHPGHPHYDDMIELWSNVEYHLSFWLKEDVMENMEGSLVLSPKEDIE